MKVFSRVAAALTLSKPLSVRAEKWMWTPTPTLSPAPTEAETWPVWKPEITLCKPANIALFPSKEYNVNLWKPGLESCMNGIGNNEEAVFKIVDKVMSHGKCKKVLKFGYKLVERAMSAEIGSFEDFSNFLNDFPDKWFQDMCSLKDELDDCVQKVLLPALGEYIKEEREVDGCCDPFMDVGKKRGRLSPTMEMVFGISTEMAEIGEKLVCDKRATRFKKEKSQTCGYTSIQGIFERNSGPLTWFRNFSPMLQISDPDESCSAFWGDKFTSSQGEGTQLMTERTALRNCGNHYQELFVFIERITKDLMTLLDHEPTMKNMMEMFHSFIFEDQKCMRVEVPFWILFSSDCDHDDDYNDYYEWNDDHYKDDDYFQPRSASRSGPQTKIIEVNKLISKGVRFVKKMVKGMNKSHSRHLQTYSSNRRLEDGSDFGQIIDEMMDMCISLPTSLGPACKGFEKLCEDTPKRFFVDGRAFKCKALNKFEPEEIKEVCDLQATKKPVAVENKNLFVRDYCPLVCDACNSL